MSMTYEYKSNEYDEFVIAPRYLEPRLVWRVSVGSGGTSYAYGRK